MRSTTAQRHTTRLHFQVRGRRVHVQAGTAETAGEVSVACMLDVREVLQRVSHSLVRSCHTFVSRGSGVTLSALVDILCGHAEAVRVPHRRV